MPGLGGDGKKSFFRLDMVRENMFSLHLKTVRGQFPYLYLLVIFCGGSCSQSSHFIEGCAVGWFRYCAVFFLVHCFKE